MFPFVNQSINTLWSFDYPLFISGFGVDQLRDDSLETYWQSDGPQPHLVNIQFRKKTAVSSLYLS